MLDFLTNRIAKLQPNEMITGFYGTAIVRVYLSDHGYIIGIYHLRHSCTIDNMHSVYDVVLMLAPACTDDYTEFKQLCHTLTTLPYSTNRVCPRAVNYEIHPN